MKKESKVKKMDEASISSEETILDVENLMTVEGGADNDDDWCLIHQCKTGGQCYTGA